MIDFCRQSKQWQAHKSGNAFPSPSRYVGFLNLLCNLLWDEDYCLHFSCEKKKKKEFGLSNHSQVLIIIFLKEKLHFVPLS